jgi:predicted GNAT family N-acyltransferase
MTTTTSYGRKLAWIGNVIVDRDHRGKDIGHTLVQHALDYLQRSRIKHIALYCFDENVKFYRRLGFVRDAPFVRLRRKPKPIRSVTLNPHRSLPLRALISADREAFGADRSRLIRMVLRTKAGWYLGSSKAPSASSYLLVKEYKEMYEFGPWVCIRPPRAEPGEMLHLALTKTAEKPIEVSCLSDHREALTLMRTHGFEVTSHGYRMYLDKIPQIGKPEASYALGFLDKG